MFDPCVRKFPWRREWQPTPAFLPGELPRSPVKVREIIHWSLVFNLSIKRKEKIYIGKCNWHSNYMIGRICSSTWGKCPNDTPKDVSVRINVSKNSKMFCTLIEQSRY